MADCSYIDPVQRGGARWAAELEIVSGQDKTMSPMILIASNLSTGITILPNHNDEEFGEEIVFAAEIRHRRNPAETVVAARTPEAGRQPGRH